MGDKSTPTPWHTGQKLEGVQQGIFDATGLIATISGRFRDGKRCDAANAALIVRAVNHHDELVAAAKRCENFLINHQRSLGIEDGSVDELECTKMTRTVLAKVDEAGA